MKDLAQGFIEVSSYVAAIEAADAMAKAADVTVRRVHKVDGPIVCVICEGDVAACQAAVEAAAAVSAARGTLLARNVIPRPAEDGETLYACLDEINAKKAARKKARAQASRKIQATEAPAGQAAPDTEAALASGQGAGKNKGRSAPRR